MEQMGSTQERSLPGVYLGRQQLFCLPTSQPCKQRKSWYKLGGTSRHHGQGWAFLASKIFRSNTPSGMHLGVRGEMKPVAKNACILDVRIAHGPLSH